MAMYSVSAEHNSLAGAFSDTGAAKSWEGIQDVLDYGYGCPEMSYSLKGKSPKGQFLVPQKFWSISEHCQNLNIWTKSIDPEAKKPVMVWFVSWRRLLRRLFHTALLL